ncbi:MAG: transposase [Candidatus Omnitrophica bacterium]|nr:transposase [Candidatus Omnitrophota bacterium]
MPRKSRELTDEGVYHIFNRGNNRTQIFKDPEDFEQFHTLLTQARDHLKTDIFHYCLMGNHYHLLMQIRKAPDLVRFMHAVQLGYVRWYKKKYHVMGHLFQGRYKSPRIEAESYYLHCGRYIERNPLKAHLVTQPTDYPWSSARYYGLGRPDPVLTENLYYAELGSTHLERQQRYQEFLKLHDPYEDWVGEALETM